MVDAADRIMMVNAETERTFGYSRRELIGQAVDILVPIRFRDRHPAFRAAFAANPGCAPWVPVASCLVGVRTTANFQSKSDSIRLKPVMGGRSSA
jgi:hypothetical protein